ncbi:ABC transporter substrate-binding protein [Sphingobium phenoxybenzoativorans]|uniref:ABC transporter substrate-binding protein n=1 Tax=Sphingobium phenoxybenzoativorans TaxID=1592790 RepID=UPI0009F49342|nr:ABC transporter substrate-binding protein [Sphingobium phenoxybenzoativorans]
MMGIRAAALTGIAALGLFGCAPGTSPADTPPPPPSPLAVFGHSSVLEFGPLLWAAKQAGPGAVVTASGGVPNLWNAPDPQLGGSVRGHAAGSPPPANNGLADLAGNAETQVLRMSLRYPDVRIILTVTEGLYRVVARRSSGIASLEDLKGKRIAVFANTSAAFYLHKILQKAGMTEADVTIVPLTASAGANAVIAGEVDALATWEPESERAAIALGDNGVSFHPPVYREIYNLNARASTLVDPVKRKQVVAFVRELISGCRAARETPGEMQAMLAERSGHDLDLIRASWVHHRFPCDLPGDLLDVMVEEEKWLAAAQGRTPRERSALAPLIDESILKEAMQRP